MFLLKNGIQIIENIEVADTFFKRIRGLIGRKNIEKNSGMFFPRCNFIHTFFMQINIDVVMVDKKFKVVYTKQSVRPNSFVLCCNAYHTFEFASEIISIKGIKQGDMLKIEKG